MSYSSFLQKKATEFDIDLNKPADQGRLLVYKRTLEGILGSLKSDLRQTTKGYMDVLEEDLRQIYNEFDNMLDTPDAQSFVKSKFIKSVNATRDHIREAYIEVCVASKMLEEGDTADRYRSYFEAAFNCRDALRKALKQFLIEA